MNNSIKAPFAVVDYVTNILLRMSANNDLYVFRSYFYYLLFAALAEKIEIDPFSNVLRSLCFATEITQGVPYFQVYA